MSNDAPDKKILFNDDGLVIERHPDGELRLETEDYNTEDVGIGVANIVSNYNYGIDSDTTNFIDNELVRNIEITPRQLRLSDRKQIVYELSGGLNAWRDGSRYRHDFDKTYEDLWVKDAIKLKKSIQKFKTLGELMDYFYEEYIKDSYFYDDAMGNAYDYDTQRDEEETYSKDADYIKEYAQNSYVNKSESEVIDELYAELIEETEDSASKNGLDFDEDTFKEKIQEIVHEIYKGINEQSLALFKNGGGIGFGEILKVKDIENINQGDILGFIYKEEGKTTYRDFGKVRLYDENDKWGGFDIGGFPFEFDRKLSDEEKNNPEFELKDIENSGTYWSLYSVENKSNNNKDFKIGGGVGKTKFIRQVKSMHKAIDEVILKDGTHIKGKELMEDGGYVITEISKSELESKVGRKLDGWNDDVVYYNGQKYKKCFLKPHYKIA